MSPRAVPPVVYALPENGRLFWTTEEAAHALHLDERSFGRLLAKSSDAATQILLRGRSTRGKRSYFHARYVLEAAEALAGRPWPVSRAGEKKPRPAATHGAAA